MGNQIGKMEIMKKTLNEQRQKGMVLFLMLLFIVSTSIGIGSLLYLVTEHCKQAKIEIESIKALYLAETAIQRGMYRVKAETPKETDGENYGTFSFEVGGEDITLYYKVKEHAGSNKLYDVTGMAAFGKGERTLQAEVVVNPPWEGFDYTLFSCSSIFNYAPIEYRGDIRTNGACRLYESDTIIYGDVYASQFIDEGCDERGVRYEDVATIPLVPIDLNYYESLAIDEGGTITGGNIPISEGPVAEGNFYFVGTKADPLEINGLVVVKGVAKGDVIIHGVIRGRGTLYARRNIYIPNDLEYDQTAPFPAPALTDEEACDTWVRENRTRDLVVLVAGGNIVFGDYTTAGWQNWMDGVEGKNYTDLFAKGEEDRGENFIWDIEIGQAADEGENDDVFGEPGGADWPCNYEDLDRDGDFDGLIRYNQEITTQVDFNAFTYSPGGFFSAIADNYTTVICDAVLYSPHMICGLSGNENANMTHHGGIVCDEHLHWYANSDSGQIGSCFRAYLMYDPRVHSRYRWDPTDTNYYIDSVSLPVDEKVAIYRWEELTEEE